MYIVIELQTNNGITGNFVFAYSDKADAYAKYHAILSAAAKSSVDVHAAVILNEVGTTIASSYFVHDKEAEVSE